LFSVLFGANQLASLPAQAVALMVYWAKQGVQEIQQRLVTRFDYPLQLTPDDIRPG
jgi:hypothetical protein